MPRGALSGLEVLVMDKLIEYAPLLARGTLVTIALALVSLALATLLGGLAAAGRDRRGAARGATPSPLLHLHRARGA